MDRERELLEEVPISELEELREEIHTETIIAMYLMDQLNKQKKAIHELYEKERVLKSEIVERSEL
jgi:wyosine [tRNA(Phe)-imidazoG37] synthetase (radical SAM superfamily)